MAITEHGGTTAENPDQLATRTIPISPEELQFLDQVVAGTMEAYVYTRYVDGQLIDEPDAAVAYFRRDPNGKIEKGSTHFIWHGAERSRYFMRSDKMRLDIAQDRSKFGHDVLEGLSTQAPEVD